MEENSREPMSTSKASWVKSKTQMQTSTRMDKVVIEHYYHMTTINENVHWIRLPHVLSRFSSKLQGPFLQIYLCFKILNKLFKCTHSLMYTMYANVSDNNPSYTHVSLYVVWRIDPQGCTLDECVRWGQCRT